MQYLFANFISLIYSVYTVIAYKITNECSKSLSIKLKGYTRDQQ